MNMLTLEKLLGKVRSLVDVLDDDPPHPRQVARLALEIFDQTRDLHGLDRTARALLEATALLHDTGYRYGAAAHHKRSRDIILGLDLAPVPPLEHKMIACIARYHRKAHPKPTHRLYGDLPEAAQKTVRRLAAILRVADGLDRDHQQTVTEVQVARVGKNVVITAFGASALNLYGAQRKAALFAEEYGTALQIVC